MIDHAQYRRALLADPSSVAPELELHRSGCAECQAFTSRLLDFENRLARAMRLPAAPDGVRLATSRASPRDGRRVSRSSGSRRWLAMAASILIVVALGGVFWLAAPQPSLAADVVAHMSGESGAWRTRAAVGAEHLENVLSATGIRLDAKDMTVSYANACSFRGYVVPHLVVQSAHGPVTVMVLAHEPAMRRYGFDEGGYRGVIVPVPRHGSLAVLMQSPSVNMEDVDEVAHRVQGAIRWADASDTGD